MAEVMDKEQRQADPKQDAPEADADHKPGQEKNQDKDKDKDKDPQPPPKPSPFRKTWVRGG